ncbi:SapB/AmfS family lantipeptide [Streptococcus suis]|nr:SapB/AmfS family lantipeptide [Streptococcus suis]
MADEVLKLQTLSVEEETDEVDGMRFSTTSLSWCGNWSMISAFGC